MRTIIKSYSGNYKFTYKLNALVAFVYWLVFHPGLFSTDSFAAYEMAKSGNLDNPYTASWAIYIRYFSLYGNAISLLTLINVLILSYAVTRLCIVLFDKKTAAAVAFFMCLSPGVSGIGITLWHDIPMTSGFLLVLSSLIGISKVNASRRMVLIDLTLGSILVTFRPNGLPTLALVFALALIFRKLQVFAKPLALSLLIAGTTTLIASYVGIGQAPINRYFSQEWMRNDLSCFASNSTKIDFANVTKIPPHLHESWKSEEACTFLNRFSLSKLEKQNSLEYVPMSWINLVKDQPMFILKTHLKRNAYLNPIPLYGIPSTPFLHTNVEFEDRGIKWTFQAIADKSRNILRSWNYIRPVTGWVGLWLAIITTLFVITRDRNHHILLIFAVSLTLILFVFAPIPDGRYGLPVLIIGQALLVNKLLIKYLDPKGAYE